MSMNTEVKNFPRNTDVKDMLYLIYQSLDGIGSGVEDIAKKGGSAVVRYETSNITGIPGSVLDMLECGDQVAKVTGVMKHLYTVSYKGSGVGQGICLTYVAAGYIETVSYDLKATGWEYNSTDVTNIDAVIAQVGVLDSLVVEVAELPTTDPIEITWAVYNKLNTAVAIKCGSQFEPKVNLEEFKTAIPEGHSANAAFGTVAYIGGSLDSYSVYLATASDRKYYLVIAES